MTGPVQPVNGAGVPGRFSIAVVVALAVQFSAVIWFMAQLEARVAANEQFRLKNQELDAQIMRLDERFDGVFRDLDRIEARLVRFEQRLTTPPESERR